MALVCWIRGEVYQQPITTAPFTRLELFDQLRPGTIVRTAEDAELIFVFPDGRRFAVEPLSHVHISRGDPEVKAGTITRLEPVPPMATLPRLDPTAHPGTRPGASRIRRPAHRPWSFTLAPRSGSTVLADAALLRFTPLPGIERYQVEVNDLTGTPLFSARINASRPQVQVPPELVRPGTSYHWRVRSRTDAHSVTHGDAIFTTLDAARAEERSRLAERAAAEEDASMLLLLAALDHQSGLTNESCNHLAAVARQHPRNDALSRIRTRMDCPAAL